MREALKVYDTSLIREPRWGDDFFGIEPFYIVAGECYRGYHSSKNNLLDQCRFT